MQTSLVTPYVFSALVVIVCANAGLAETLGAHPFWAVSVAWVGVPIGLVLAIVAKRIGLTWMMRILGFLICLAGAYAVASFGKERFATSFAEDTFGGRMWYFGWIAVTGFSAAFIAAVFSPTAAQSNG